MHCKDTTVELEVDPEEPEVLIMTCLVSTDHNTGHNTSWMVSPIKSLSWGVNRFSGNDQLQLETFTKFYFSSVWPTRWPECDFSVVHLILVLTWFWFYESLLLKILWHLRLEMWGHGDGFWNKSPQNLLQTGPSPLSSITSKDAHTFDIFPTFPMSIGLIYFWKGF